ncbi:molybdenum cofactor guanylyltransferase [Massilia sp. TS11]|nr:gephyrin-like molybdotransferase Glp [Massilia sp. TS11]MCG2582810.1 molybdenum cofactor guanylyltransferase [Massilia sp. TS11]
MGEADKGLQLLRGRPLIEHVLERLRPQCAQISISANRNGDRYAAYGHPVLPDRLPGFAGPLAGLERALSAARTPLLLVVPCDLPFLPADLAARLLAALEAEQADLAVAVTEDDGQLRLHPTCSLLKTALAPQLQAYLAGGGRKMRGWWPGLKVAEVRFPDAAAFRNMNSRADLHTFAMPSLSQATATLPSYDPDAMSVPAAQRVIQAMLNPVPEVEALPLAQALGRVLAQDLMSPIDVPAHDNSAMDGYALRGADLPASGSASLRVSGTAYAGQPYTGSVAAGACVRIMTGAVMPDGCDTVIPFELVSAADAAAITITAGSVRPGANRRFAGEDLRAGRPALHAGRVLRPADLGLIASLGIASVSVRRRLKVAVFSTGDELRAAGEPLGPGAIYDSNRSSVCAMLARLGCEVRDLGIVRDDPDALEAALRAASADADAIITSGGVSSGDADHTRAVLARLGEVAFWKLAMRPGRPLAFGRIGARAMLFGLPGNPVATMISFYFFVREALLTMMGASLPLPLLRVRSQGPIRKRPGRTEYQRGIVELGGDGRQHVRLTGNQGSGILRSMVEANCIVVLPAEQGDLAAGDEVDILLFDGLV